MDRGVWVLNITFLVVLVVFIGISLWHSVEADRAHACLLDDDCVAQYRSKTESTQLETPTYKPTVHPIYLNGRFQTIFF